ncbi:hypothetical protein PSEUDO9AG_70342 [Pseudomonas sp. 9Ag]|nr:hypothetical protein PSEUDO9AG_70342 [Pseudomonas sp. 9Ag]
MTAEPALKSGFFCQSKTLARNGTGRVDVAFHIHAGGLARIGGSVEREPPYDRRRV